MTLRHGARHDPAHPAMATAIDYAMIAVEGPTLDANWFGAWNWPATGNDLGNAGEDGVSNCCEAADIVLTEGFRALRGLSPLEPAVLTELALLRYAQVAGYLGTPATDNGSIPAEDCFAWQAAPIVADGHAYRVKWATVRTDAVFSALRRGPLLLTIALTAADEDDPELWHKDPVGSPVAYHRVVAGASKAGMLTCRTYGRDVPVAGSRVVAADLLLSVDLPADLRTAGIDWEALV